MKISRPPTQKKSNFLNICQPPAPILLRKKKILDPDTFCTPPSINLVHNVDFASVIVCSASMNVIYNFAKEAADFGLN